MGCGGSWRERRRYSAATGHAELRSGGPGPSPTPLRSDAPCSPAKPEAYGAGGEADREVGGGLEEEEVTAGVEGIAEGSGGEFGGAEQGTAEREVIQARAAAQAADDKERVPEGQMPWPAAR